MNMDVLNLVRNDFGKEVIVSGIEGTVAQVLKDIALYDPFLMDTSLNEKTEKFILLMDRLEREMLEGTYNYLGWKLIIDKIYENQEFGFTLWAEAREFFDRIKEEGQLVLKYYPGEIREIEAYKLNRRNSLVRKVLGLD